MSIPAHLSSYLRERGARYEIYPHRHSHSSAETAHKAHVPASRLAKSVLLEDANGYLMAVIPADKTVMLGELGRMLGRKELRLADEKQIAMLFNDCEIGAVPPIGMAWGVETVVDDELETNEVVYMEAGDHELLLKMPHEQFHRLMFEQKHGHFCRHPTH